MMLVIYLFLIWLSSERNKLKSVGERSVNKVNTVKFPTLNPSSYHGLSLQRKADHCPAWTLSCLLSCAVFFFALKVSNKLCMFQRVSFAISKKQHCFMPHRSNLTNLIYVIDSITQCFDNGVHVDIVYLGMYLK